MCNILKYSWNVLNQHISTKSVYSISKSIEYLFIYKNISESQNCNVAMKYFGIIDKNVAAIFHLQWKIVNISDMFLQYSVLCGRRLNLSL